MFIAVDDTDSMKGYCTTFLATEIIRELLPDFDLIGNPRLVRMNPAVPWKTRGNGSLVMRFGRGSGEKHLIGEIDGNELYCYESSSDDSFDADAVMQRLIPLVEHYNMEESDPGLIISAEKPDSRFYKKGLTEILYRKDVEPELERIGAKVFTIRKGRGIIGGTCGLAWIPDDTTYELLAYRMPDRWGTKRSFDPQTIRKMDFSFPTTFNSWEEREQKVAMVPATPCPVLYGLRGDVMEDLIPASRMIKSEQKYRWVIFLTNQGTDDHIIHDAEMLRPNASYLVRGTVCSRSRHIEGGHTFIDMDTRYGQVTVGAYEPSKEFRMAFDRLIPGDVIEVMGEFREQPATLNAEKLHVISLTEDLEKVSNPLCPSCGRRMDSIGKGQGYRCRRCHIKTKAHCVYEKHMRWIVPGWYEPPTAARRHLSKPLKRMGLEQPCEFLPVRQ